MDMNRNSFTIFDSIDSTNNYAMGQIKKGLAGHGNAWMALEQTAGKGRRNKQWVSQKGENIMLSISIETSHLAISRQFELSMAVALGCHDFFSKYAGEGVKIKWPNDIYFHDNKSGGILIETAIKGNKWQWAVIGIGININQVFFGEDFPNATSLKLITGIDYDITLLGRELHSCVMKRIESLDTNKDIVMEYNSLLYKRDRKVKLKKGAITFETTIISATADGQLHTHDTLERSFSFDEIEWII
jgi:BirA family transcriptional regulator, biotin operon repressor / biotin---[acetyl-CoA-carboxylase] ligase